MSPATAWVISRIRRKISCAGSEWNAPWELQNQCFSVLHESEYCNIGNEKAK